MAEDDIVQNEEGRVEPWAVNSRVRRMNREIISQIHQTVTADGFVTTRCGANVQKQHLRAAYDAFTENHTAIIGLPLTADKQAEQRALLTRTMEAYSVAMTALDQQIENLTPAQDVPQQAVAPIQVEVSEASTIHTTCGTFDGDIYYWRSFRDKFVASVHENERIKPVMKLQHLLKALSGKAAEVVGTRQATEAEYNGAWQRLQEVYDDEYLIVRTVLKRLTELPKLSKASNDGLRKLIDTTHETKRQLATLGVPVEHWDVMFGFLLVEKLDEKTAEAWEMHPIQENLPTLKEICDFLEKRARSMAHVQPTEPVVDRQQLKRKNEMRPCDQMTKRPTMNAQPGTSKPLTCSHCQGDHPLFRCEKFLSLNLAGRKDFVIKAKLCTNCLNFGHFGAKCSMVACPRCPDHPKHNSVLCPNLGTASTTAATVTEKKSRKKRGKSASAVKGEEEKR